MFPASSSLSKTSMSDFKIERLLGKGSFSSVYLVTRIADQKIYALKSVTMDKLTKKEQQNSVNEVRILASVSHPNVIGYREAFWDDKNQTLNIVMEYADDGDLQTKIQQMKKNFGVFEEETIWSYAIQMIEGLKALHDKKIMHRDLKSANIFLAKNISKNKKICKIGDMNVSKVMKEKVLMTQTGTPYYASPEVWNDKPYSYKSDLWSIGCVIYELCALKPPFKGKDLDELYINVCKGKVERIKKIYSEKLWKMIMMLLQVDVNKRVDCDQFLNHPIVIQKIKEMKMKDIEYKDLEDNKISKEGCLLNTINFKDLKEIKAQLPTKKNYGNNNINNINNDNNNNYENRFNNINNNYLSNNNSNNKYIIKNEYYSSFENNKNKDENINNINNKIKNENNFNNYYNYLNERINKLLNSNNNNKNYNISKEINNNNINNINISNDYHKTENNSKHHNDHLNIINDKSTNHYTELLDKIKEYNLHSKEAKNLNNFFQYEKNNNNNSNMITKNYNKFDHILYTDIDDKNLIRNNKDKMNMISDGRLTYENLKTEERINYSDKILKLKKEKNKIIEKQKEKKIKTIEDRINEYKNLFNKKIEPSEQKFNNYLNIINYYNNDNDNNKINKNNNDIIYTSKTNTNNKKEKYNANIFTNNKKDKDNKYIKMHKLTLSPNSRNKNIIPTSTKDNSNNEIIYKKINHNKNNQHNNKESSRILLNKKVPSYQNFNEREKTPSSKYINNTSDKAIINKNNKNILNYNEQNLIMNTQISKDYYSPSDKKSIIDNIKKNINSIKNSTNPIKRINKPYLNISKKRNTGIETHHHHNNNSKIRQKSAMTLKKYNNKNSNMCIDLNNYNTNNISNCRAKYQHKHINYDLNKDLNDINLTSVDANVRNNNNLPPYKTPKLTLDIDANNINNKKENKKHFMNLNNSKMAKKMPPKSNNFNYIIPNSINSNNNNMNNNNQILQNAKKLNARSHSYRIASHGNNYNYIKKKRNYNYKCDLTEPGVKANENMKLNTSKNGNSQIINYSLINNGLNFLSIGNNNVNTNELMNNIKNNEINNNNQHIEQDNRYFINMNIPNTTKTPQIFNNYYSINGVTAGSPIKVINVFNN